MPLYGHELDESTNPIEAGLKFACNLKDRSFIGDQAIRDTIESGPKKVRIGLIPEGKRPAREGCEVLSASGEKIGVVTSGGPSPTLGHPIAMAYVDASHGNESSFQIDIRGKQINANACKIPFYKRTTS